MDVDQKTLERIAVALERIAKALGTNPPNNSTVFTKEEIVASVNDIVLRLLKATPILASQNGSAPTVQSTPKPAMKKDWLKPRNYGGFQSIAPSAEVLASLPKGKVTVSPVLIKTSVSKAEREEAKNIPAKKIPQKQPVKQPKKTPGSAAKKTPPAPAAKKTPPTPAAKRTLPTPINSAKKKMAVLRKTPAGQQLSDFFANLGLTIVNPDAIEPIIKHQKFANAIWQFRSVSFDLMGKISSAIRLKTTHKLDLTGKTNAVKESFKSLCDSASKAKLITFDHHENCIEIHPDEGQNNYFSGRWGEDVIVTMTLRVANSLNSQHGKQICSVFRNIEYKKNASEKLKDSECDVVLVVKGKFYFIEVKTGKQQNTGHFVSQVGHLEDKKEYSIYCSIDKENAPEEIRSLCGRNNFAIYGFEDFEASLTGLIKQRQSYCFETPSRATPASK